MLYKLSHAKSPRNQQVWEIHYNFHLAHQIQCTHQIQYKPMELKKIYIKVLQNKFTDP